MIDDYPEYENYSCKTIKKTVPVPFPPQHQDKYPGLEYIMNPKPIFDNPNYKASGKLQDKVAIISGSDSGIGRSVAIHYAREGCNVTICYTEREEKDAQFTKNYIDNIGNGKCILCSGDLRNPKTSKRIVDRTLEEYHHLDVIVNNCAIQIEQKDILNISNEQLWDVFQVNVFSYFYMIQAALPFLPEYSSIINTSSIVAKKGSPHIIDYSMTKGAINTLSRSLALNLADKKIRINTVSPGSFWSPLQPSCWDSDTTSMFGSNSLLKRCGQPFEIAPIYVYLASDESRYVTGTDMEINGGDYMD